MVCHYKVTLLTLSAVRVNADFFKKTQRKDFFIFHRAAHVASMG